MRAAAFAAGIAFGLGAITGAIAEHVRPFGTEWHRRNGVNLARHMARMTAARCCHD